MFDISFFELMMIGVVALIVLGPERLPKVARTVGQWVSRAQRYANEVKADITREVDLSQLQSLKQQVQEAGQTLETSIRTESAKLATDLKGVLPEGAPSDQHPAVLGSPAVEQIVIPKQLFESDTATPIQSPPAVYAGNSVLDPAFDPQLQRMEVELLSDEIFKLEDRLIHLRRQADALRNMYPPA
jgi:sec-independent protein translocase protein TatB